MEKKKVTLEKDGVAYTLSDPIMISAFLNSGFVEKKTKSTKKASTKAKREVATDEEISSND
ncbi:hypothetical protein MMJ00_10615 [Enterococcus cecorum]|uniref:hypothetical protein n=1 Tax=Enterococcus cecorum TaxID=44008 RepID=UPI001FAE09F0|nr:hypothetical protein [Enterococcus cecorum]MCJ0604441.1 hypothetical protein [Enterococcus cecorum]